MATITFLWHLHQPGYRTADRVSHTPWVPLHAGGSYMTLASAILETGARGHVVNIVPSLLEQMLAYANDTVVDPVINALICPSPELGTADREILLEWCFSVTPTQMTRFPRLRELQVRRLASDSVSDRTGLFGPGDLRDLQTLFILAQAGEQAWRDPQLAPLFKKESRFSADDHLIAATWLQEQPSLVITMWRRLTTQPGVEVATSPFAHPIMPLLIDTKIVTESWAPSPAPKVPDFTYPEDARWQLDEGLTFMRNEGFAIVGCWPPEGSVSIDALRLYNEAGIRWLVADEGILSRSLDVDLRGQDSAKEELYRPWRPISPSPILFFRDRQLSDLIGFTYGHWKDEESAAQDLINKLVKVAGSLPNDAAIVIALDGENPWLHYPDGGGLFLRALMRGLNEAGNILRPSTFRELIATSLPRLLPKLHPGSWINSVFATWIGHDEKTQAWKVLAQVRNLLKDQPGERSASLLLAEGSDWFWWLGDDNPNPQAPLFDKIFRLHLTDACIEAGIDPPAELERPIKITTQALRVPISAHWPRPVLDGRIGSYFEWSIATSISSGAKEGLSRVSLWSGPSELHLLIEGTEPMSELMADENLMVHLQVPDGDDRVVIIGERTEAATSFAIGNVVEVSIPWGPGPGYRLRIGLGPQQIPAGASVSLEPYVVD